MIPYSVSEGEATCLTSPFRSSPSLSRPSHYKPTLAEPPQTSLSSTRACTLSRCAGLVPHGNRKQASTPPSPALLTPPQALPNRPVPALDTPPQPNPPHAESPCLVVARGPSNRYGETKTDTPIQSRPIQAKPVQTPTNLTAPTPSRYPTDMPTRCRRGGAEYARKPRWARSETADRT
jgi:hypothetical protein